MNDLGIPEGLHDWLLEIDYLLDLPMIPEPAALLEGGDPFSCISVIDAGMIHYTSQQRKRRRCTWTRTRVQQLLNLRIYVAPATLRTLSHRTRIRSGLSNGMEGKQRVGWAQIDDTIFSIQSMTLVVNGLDPRTHCPPKSLNTTNGKKSRAPMPLRYHVVAVQAEDSSPCSPDIMSWRCKLKTVHLVPRSHISEI